MPHAFKALKMAWVAGLGTTFCFERNRDTSCLCFFTTAVRFFLSIAFDLGKHGERVSDHRKVP